MCERRLYWSWQKEYTHTSLFMTCVHCQRRELALAVLVPRTLRRGVFDRLGGGRMIWHPLDGHSGNRVS